MLLPKISIEYSKHFLNERKKYVKNNLDRVQNYSKTVKLFLADPKYPSLKLEKLQGLKDMYTIRLNKSDRIFLNWKDSNTALFIDIGKHDKYRTKS